MPQISIVGNKDKVSELFLQKFGCPQTVVDRLAAYTAGASAMLDFLCSIEAEPAPPAAVNPEDPVTYPNDKSVVAEAEKKANIVNLVKDKDKPEKGT